MQETKEWEREMMEKKKKAYTESSEKRVMIGKRRGGKGNKSLATEIMIKWWNEKRTKSTTKKYIKKVTKEVKWKHRM